MTTLLHAGVTAQAEERPEATALVWKRRRTSYGELELASNQLAQLLVDTGCRSGDRVAILMQKCPTAIVAMLGVLKTGAAYVPLDPKDATSRLARTLQIADCRWLLAAGPVAGHLQDLLKSEFVDRPPLIGWLDDAASMPEAPAAIFKWDDLALFPTTPPVTDVAEHDLAHILFTSGSTGTPKGVMVGHASVARFLDWAIGYFAITEGDRCTLHSPLRFDVSTFDIYGTLWAGGELHLVPPELNLAPHKLVKFARDAELTQWMSVPSALNLVAQFDALRDRDLPSLRRVLFAGEVLPTRTLIYWMQRVPQAQFTNLYGPTETTISSSYFTILERPTDERAPIPIGNPCDGEEFLLFDAEMRPTPDGEVGNLYIRGAGLSPGYWRNPEMTAKAFIARPGTEAGTGDLIYKTGDLARRDSEGLYYFCGRTDMQIKSRGYRIELGEIESALNTVPEIGEGAVVAIDSDGFESTLICCAYASAPGMAVSLKELRSRLGELLPAYMLPARWLEFVTLPKNESGKVDRANLRAKFLAAEEKATPGCGGKLDRRQRHSAYVAVKHAYDEPRR